MNNFEFVRMNSLLFLGAAFGFCYGIKSLIIHYIKFRKYIENSHINVLFKIIQKKDGKQQGLQYFKKMYLTGLPIQGADTFYTLRSFFCEVFFNWKILENLKVQMIFPRYVFFNLGEKYVYYIPKAKCKGEQYLLFGDFIYNSKSQVVRCYNIRSLSRIKDLDKNIINRQFYLQNIIHMLLKIGFVGICIYVMIKIIIGNNRQLNSILQSKYYQNTRCQICNNQNSHIIEINCSHLVSCEQYYGSRRYFCPICKNQIQINQQIYND